jgi:hypothetical protein
VFSGNQISGDYGYGGAIFSSGAATISGCTFIDNHADSIGARGGAIYRQNGTVTLTGNIFSGNTAATYPVAYGSPAPTSGGYNASDKAIADTNSSSGWSSGTGDAEVTGGIVFTDFKPSSTGLPAIPDPSLLEGFPVTYFDGTNRGPGSAPGAMPKAAD